VLKKKKWSALLVTARKYAQLIFFSLKEILSEKNISCAYFLAVTNNWETLKIKKGKKNFISALQKDK